MRVLIIGGAGYVGAVLLRRLLDKGHQVRVLDRFYYGSKGIEGMEDRIESVVGDMRHIDPGVLDGVDAVVNLGGLSNDPTAEYNPRVTFEMNTEGAARAALLCREHGIDRYVLASSASVYDGATDDHTVDLDEEAKLCPRATYARSKLEAERRVLPLADGSFCPVALRKGTVFGYSPRMRYDLAINTMVKDALRNGSVHIHTGVGEMWRPLVDIQDAADAYVACLEAPAEKVRGQVFNVALFNTQITPLAHSVAAVLGAHGFKTEVIEAGTPVGVRSYRISTEKIRRELGFVARVSVEESVANILASIRRDGCEDFENPRYYNIHWMMILEETAAIVNLTGGLFDLAPSRSEDKEAGKG